MTVSFFQYFHRHFHTVPLHFPYEYHLSLLLELPSIPPCYRHCTDSVAPLKPCRLHSQRAHAVQIPNRVMNLHRYNNLPSHLLSKWQLYHFIRQYRQAFSSQQMFLLQKDRLKPTQIIAGLSSQFMTQLVRFPMVDLGVLTYLALLLD